MNKIFKVVWSKTKNSYVVVSEIAKRNGKCSSSLNKKLITAFLAAGTVLSVTGSAWAADSPADSLSDDEVAKLHQLATDATTIEQLLKYVVVNSTGTAASAVGTNAIAVGSGAVAEQEYSVAIGASAVAPGKGAIAIGKNTNAGQSNAIAIGISARGASTAAIAIGNGADASNTEGSNVAAVAIGEGSKSYNLETVAIGKYAKSDSNYATVVGARSVLEGGTNGSAGGQYASIFGPANTLKNSDYSLMVGNKNTLNSDGKSRLYRDYIIGYNNKIERLEDSIIIGGNNNLKNTENTSKLSFNQFIGSNNSFSTVVKNTTVIGNNNELDWGVGNIIIGEGHTLKGTSKSDSNNAKNNIVLGMYDEETPHKAKLKETVMIGRNADAQANFAVAIGSGVKAEKSAVSLGYKAEAGKENAIAIGNGVTVSGKSSIAIGSGHEVSGDNSGAFGDPSSIEGNNSYSVGNNNEINKDSVSVFALGNSITTVKSNSVFLGDEAAYVAKEKNTGGMDAVINATVNGFAFGKFAGSTPVGVVSIGDVGKERRIQNIAAGLITADSTDAINGSQLYAAIDAMQFDIVAGDNVEVIKETSNGHTKYTIHSLNAIVKPGENITVTGDTPETTTATNGQTTDLTASGTGGTPSEPTPSPDNKPITPSESNNHTTTYTVSAADSKVDSVKVEKGESKTTGDTTETEYNVTITSNEQSVDEEGNIVTTPVDKKTSFTVTDLDTRNKIVAGENITVTASGNDEEGPVTYTISAQASSNVKVINGENTTVTEGEDGDFTTYAVNVKTDGKVASGDKGIVSGDTVYKETRVEKDGNYIKKDNTAAENITALDEKVKDNSTRIDNINNQFGDLDNRMRKGLAGAAALAALHPMDFNPDDKLQFSAGVGNYRGETAAALGMFYRPDESVMFSLGGTFGNSDNMVNAGITFGLDGTRNRISRSRTAMAKEIVELRSLVTQMAARMDRLEGGTNLETAMFPDVPENHWAYEYVEDLQKRGAIKGYPDGLFKGDRSMTRYEFAAMLDRLVRSGVTLDSKIAKEFEPELGRIYVERISGQDNDRKKVERVRVNNSDSKYPEGKTRDVYGSKIVTEIPKAAGTK